MTEVPGPPPEAASSDPESPAAMLERDVQRLKHDVDQFNMQHPIPYESLPPPDTEMLENFGTDPLDLDHLHVLALIERGYPITCTDTALTVPSGSRYARWHQEGPGIVFSEEPEVVPGMGAAYAPAGSWDALQEIGGLTTERPSATFLGDMTEGIVHSGDVLKDTLAEHSLEAGQWSRAFVTSHLRRFQLDRTSSPAEDAQYLEQRRMGVEPYTSEELLGFARAALQSVIEEYPELAPDHL